MDLPIKNGDFPWQNVSSPEGRCAEKPWLFKGQFFPCEAPTKASWPSPMLTIGSWPCWRMTSLQSRTKEPRCRRIGVAVGVLRLYMQGGIPYLAKLANLTPIAGVYCRCIIICLVHKNQLMGVINQPISRRGTTLWVLTMVPTLINWKTTPTTMLWHPLTTWNCTADRSIFLEINGNLKTSRPTSSPYWSYRPI